MKFNTDKKNSGKAPAYQMYPMDWNENAKLKMCSYAVEGIWIRLVNTSYGMPIKGVFVQEINSKSMNLLNQKPNLTPNQQVNYVPLTLKEIAYLLRGETEEKIALLNELVARNILKQFTDGEYAEAFYVKRMYRDMKLRAIRAEAGKQGGNPNLVGNLLNQNSNQNPTPSSSSSSSISLINNTTPPTGANFSENEVLAEATLVGITEEQGKAFYAHYKSQGWKFGNGLAITDLPAALVRWRNNGYKFEKPATGGRAGSGIKSKALTSYEKAKAELKAGGFNG